MARTQDKLLYFRVCAKTTIGRSSGETRLRQCHYHAKWFTWVQVSISRSIISPFFSDANSGTHIGPSCHWHATTRFFKAFKFALAMYLPLQLLLKMRHPSLSQLQKACREATRSSVFLGAFVALFYYGVCLSRTRLGPKLVSKETVTPLMWDSGLCVRAGCILCGWSILIEAEKRRQELAMFVVPRAAATLFPRRYDKKACRPSCLAFETFC